MPTITSTPGAAIRCTDTPSSVAPVFATAAAMRPYAARTAEAAVLYHANQLDAVAATRSVDGTGDTGAA